MVVYQNYTMAKLNLFMEMKDICVGGYDSVDILSNERYAVMEGERKKNTF